MTKRLTSKHKIDLRLGVNLWGSPKSPINKRNAGPGQHGQNRRKPSDYGLQLRGKQKMRGYYNITEKQFRRLYEEAARRQGDTGENLVGLLERRLDAVIYRLKFAPTIFTARQFVSHGHIKVNGKRVNIPSYQVREGDTIEISQKLAENVVFLQGVSSADREVPDYLEADAKNLKAKFVRVPNLSDIPYPVKMEPNLVTEYYSR